MIYEVFTLLKLNFFIGSWFIFKQRRSFFLSFILGGYLLCQGYKVNGEVLKLTNLRPTVHSFPPPQPPLLHAPFLHFARIFADALSSMSEAQIIPVSLFGSPLLTLQSKIMTYFFMSSLLYLNRWDFVKVPKYVFSTC